MRRNLLVWLTLASVFVAALAVAHIAVPGCIQGPLYRPRLRNGLQAATAQTTFDAETMSRIPFEAGIPVRGEPAGEAGRPLHCGQVLPGRPGSAPEWRREKFAFMSEQG